MFSNNLSLGRTVYQSTEGLHLSFRERITLKVFETLVPSCNTEALNCFVVITTTIFTVSLIDYQWYRSWTIHPTTNSEGYWGRSMCDSEGKMSASLTPRHLLLLHGFQCDGCPSWTWVHPTTVSEPWYRSRLNSPIIPFPTRVDSVFLIFLPTNRPPPFPSPPSPPPPLPITYFFFFLSYSGW